METTPEEFYEIIGLDCSDSDAKIADGRPHIIMCLIDNAFIKPIAMSGSQWDICYWMWKLSDTDSDFNQYLADFISQRV